MTRHGNCRWALAAAMLAVCASGAKAGIAVTKAEISAGRLMVSGTRTGTAPRIVLDGRFDADVAANGSFAFTLIYLPSDCIVKLEADGGTGGEELAVVGNCAPRSLRPRGAWRGGAQYAENDIVTDDGSAYRAKSANTGKKPALNASAWEVFAARGERGQQGIQGATGPRGSDGAPGESRAAPLLLDGEQSDARIAGAYGFVGPVGEITLNENQLIVIPRASISLRLVNGAADTTADLAFCFTPKDGNALTPFDRIPESVSLALPHGKEFTYAQDFDLMAAAPGMAGTFSAGACMRHHLPGQVSIGVSSFAVSKTLVYAGK